MTTDNLTDAEINLRLAEALDVTLKVDKVVTLCTCGVNADRPKCFFEHGALCPRWDILQAAKSEHTPPNWAGSLELAFELGGEMLHRQHDMEYGQYLVTEALKSDGESCLEFQLAHLGPRQRALAALRTLEEAKDDR
jgi:hypothetical protein